MSARKGPFKLVTVNTAPERAKRLIGRMIESLKDQYDIEYIDNCESKTKVIQLEDGLPANLCSAGIDEVVPKVTKHEPNVLVGGISHLIFCKVTN
jgi:hypothetical protein